MREGQNFYLGAKNGCVTTATISGIFCDLGVFHFLFTGGWACRLRCGPEHTPNDLNRVACVSSTICGKLSQSLSV
jgi:hypothetical protein